jgi:hypothetical protein
MLGKLSLLLLFGCASWFTPEKSRDLVITDKPIKDIKRLFSYQCLSGQGRGRLEMGEDALAFNFESYLNYSKKQWALGVNLPLMGQEVFRIDYKNQKLMGSLYEKIQTSLKTQDNQKEVRRTMSEVRVTLSVLFRLLDDIRRDDFKQRCKILLHRPKDQRLRFICFDRFTGFERSVTTTIESDRIKMLSKTRYGDEVELNMEDFHLGTLRQSELVVRKKKWMWVKFELFNFLLRAHKCRN